MSTSQHGLRAPSLIFYNLDGIASEEPRADLFWIMEGWDSFSLKENDLTYDIEASAFALRNWIATSIFGSLPAYYDALASSNMLIVQGGIDSDIKVSKEMFEKYARNFGTNERKLIYYHDFISLVGALQNSVQEVKHLLGEFYKEFNINSFMLGPPPEADIVMHASGLLVTKLFAFVNYIFITLYSQMDFLAKMAYECQHMEKSFEKYPRLKSAGILIGDAARLKWKGMVGTVFEKEVPDLRMIETLRNEIVHNASFEDRQKVFQSFKKGVMVEKFIFLPDFQNGALQAFGSRRRFFNDEVKLNMILPGLVIGFWRRVDFTLKQLLAEPSA